MGNYFKSQGTSITQPQPQPLLLPQRPASLLVPSINQSLGQSVNSSFGKPVNSQNALAYNASQSTLNQNMSPIATFNNPNNLYILIDTTNLQNCIKSNNMDLSQILNCVSTYIKGVGYNSNGSNYVVTNLLSTQQNGTGFVSPMLSAQQIQQLQSSIFTAYGAPNNIASQLTINLNSLWSIINSSNNVALAITSSIQTFNSSTNSYVNVSQLGTGITCDSNGNMIIPQSLTPEQNFEVIEKFIVFENDTKTIILILCILLYLTILIKY